MGIIFLAWLCASAVCDAKYRKCFNFFTVSGFILAILSAGVLPETAPVNIDFLDGVFGFFGAFFIFLIFYAIGMMGAGDVKFAAVLGLWVGWKLLLPIWALSCLFAVFHGLFSRSLFKYFFAITYAMRDGREADNKKFIPYVTYLSLATIIVMGFYKNQ